MWDAVLAAGAEYDILPCGLGARDTLRTEMGYPLHGHDLSPEISPVMANLGWAVGWNKDTFWGADALREQREAKAGRLLRGLKAKGRGIPRPDMVVQVDGAEVGTITSGTFSPTLSVGIALALLDRTVTLGDTGGRGRPRPPRALRGRQAPVRRARRPRGLADPSSPRSPCASCELAADIGAQLTACGVGGR